MFFCTMTLISLVLCIYYIETLEKKIIFHSIFTMTLPITVLNACWLLKIVFIKTENTKFLLCVHFLVISTITLLILRMDCGIYVSWGIICVNPGTVLVLFMGKIALECVGLVRNKEYLKALFSGCCLLGCASGVMCMVFVERFLVFSIPAIFMFKLTGWITICLLGVGYSINTGEFLIQIIFGHVEIDFLMIKNPMKWGGRGLNRCKSV